MRHVQDGSVKVQEAIVWARVGLYIPQMGFQATLRTEDEVEGAGFVEILLRAYRGETTHSSKTLRIYDHRTKTIAAMEKFPGWQNESFAESSPYWDGRNALEEVLQLPALVEVMAKHFVTDKGENDKYLYINLYPEPVDDQGKEPRALLDMMYVSCLSGMDKHGNPIQKYGHTIVAQPHSRFSLMRWIEKCESLWDPRESWDLIVTLTDPNHELTLEVTGEKNGVPKGIIRTVYLHGQKDETDRPKRRGILGLLTRPRP